MIFVDAIAQKDHAEAFRERSAFGRGLGGERLKPRQGHGNAGSTKDSTAGDSVGICFRWLRHGQFLFCLAALACCKSGSRLLRNCGLVTMVSMSAEIR